MIGIRGIKMNKSIYHNELIGIISLLSILQYHKEMSLGKACLILPFFAHKSTLGILKRKNSKIRSLEELIVKYPSSCSNYNERFQSLLPVTLNSIILLKRMGLVNLKDGILSLNKQNNFELENKSLGNRAKDIVQASKKLADILVDDTSNLYLQLRVEL